MYSLRKTIHSFRYAVRGAGRVIKYENNTKVHFIATLGVLLAGFYLKISLRDWCLLILCIALVWIIEIINTALEKLVDFVSPQHHEKAGHIKDMGAAAVLVASIVAAVVGGIVFWQYLS